MRIKTVAIDRGGKRVVINRDRFDPKRHKPWGEPGQVEPEPEQAPEPKDETDEKDELIAALAELGINKDRRSSAETLRELLDEALQ